MEQKPKLLASKFLEWYISDYEDLQILGKRTAERMKQTGYGDISVEELFNDCGFIPAHIFQDITNEEDEYFNQDIEFINDLKK